MEGRLNTGVQKGLKQPPLLLFHSLLKLPHLPHLITLCWWHVTINPKFSSMWIRNQLWPTELNVFLNSSFYAEKITKKKNSIFPVGAGNHKMPFSTWLFYSSLPTHRGICICCLNMAEGSCLHLLHLASHLKRSALLQLLLLLPASNCLTRSELLCSCCCCGATPENYHQSSFLGRRNRRQPLAPKNFIGGNFG